MDMLFSLSLYPVNAMALDDSRKRANRASTDYWREADEYMMVTEVTPTRTATQMMKDKAPRRDRFVRTGKVFKIIPISPVSEYPLSHRGVLAMMK